MANKRPLEHIRVQKAGRERDGNKCQICGSEEHVEGHHILDYQFGGAASVDNISSLCSKHHKAVHACKIDLIKI